MTSNKNTKEGAVQLHQGMPIVPEIAPCAISKQTGEKIVTELSVTKEPDSLVSIFLFFDRQTNGPTDRQTDRQTQ